MSERLLAVARALAAGYRSGVHPPDVVLDAYLTLFDRDAAQLQDLRTRVEQCRRQLDVQTVNAES